ncbi:MAG: DUF4870 domain-containing protein [Sebaldella sp.]|nr:DUF4870 domain-containing protein [Sebaldella sp.]
MENNKGNAMIIYVLAIFIWVISPIIFYFAKKDGTEFERENARISLNFEIAMAVIYAVILVIVSMVPVVFFVAMLVVLAHIIINILAAVAANKGEYPNMYIPFEIIKK